MKYIKDSEFTQSFQDEDKQVHELNNSCLLITKYVCMLLEEEINSVTNFGHCGGNKLQRDKP